MKIIKYILDGVISTVGIVFTGYIFSTLWHWFIVPKFNLPELRIIEAIGICTLPSLLVGSYIYVIYSVLEQSKLKTDNEKVDYSLIFNTIKILFVLPATLFAAWIIHSLY